MANLLDIPLRGRFPIAHELAHFCLHKSESEELYAHRDAGQRDSIEREADIFAANILMPKELVEQEIEKIRADSEGDPPMFLKSKYIADAFAVSELVARTRLMQFLGSNRVC